MARTRTHIDIFQVAKPAVPINNAVRLPLRVFSPAHSTPRKKIHFDFTDTVTLGPFAHDIVPEFLRFTSGKSKKSALLYLFCVRLFLSHLAAEVGKVVPTDIMSMDTANWSLAVNRWANYIRSNKQLKASTRNQYIISVNKFIAYLQKRGMMPKFILPDGVKNSHLTQGRKLSISEVNFTRTDKALPDSVAAAGDETQALWWQLTKLSNTHDPKVMLERIDLMLGLLRSAAEEEIRNIWSTHTRTMQTIAETDVNAVFAFLEKNGGRFSRSLGSGRGSSSIFDQPARLWAYIEHKYGGVVPPRQQDPSLCRLLYNKHGLMDIRQRFHLTTDTAIPFLIVILIDTAMNVSSALDLRDSCLTATESSDVFLLSWFKDRAGGILLTAELELGSATALQHGSSAHISAPRAVECLIALRKRLVPHADPSERDRLLLVHHKAGRALRKASTDAVTYLSEAAQNQAWHRFRRRHPILAEYSITLDLIRTTILLKEALESGNSILRVQRKAQHASPTTSARYVENHATHLLNQGKVREVQEFMFASATRGHDDIRTAFGLTSERAAAILAKARKKGFGGWQHPSTAVGDEASEKQGTIAHWITNGEHFTIEDEYVAAEMHAFRRHIIAEAPSLRSSPSWDETWAPLLLLLNVTLQKMNADTRLRGKAIADEFEIVYGDLN